MYNVLFCWFQNLDRKAIDEISKKLEQDPDSVPLKYLNIAELNLLRKYCFSGVRNLCVHVCVRPLKCMI